MRSIVVKVIFEGKINQICIKDVLHVSKLHADFLSVNKLMSNGLKVLFNLNQCIVNSYDSEYIGIAVREHNLEQSPMIDDAFEFWHHRLGHLNVKGVYTL